MIRVEAARKGRFGLVFEGKASLYPLYAYGGFGSVLGRMI
jgi:hypothetical protein